MRVLLVDDSEEDREILLQDQPKGWRDQTFTEVDSFAAFRRAVRTAAKPFDCILLDLNLGDLNGYETFFQALELCPDSAIIVLTGDTDRELNQRLMEHGAQSYIVKSEMTDPRALHREIFNAVTMFTHTIRISSESSKVVAEGIQAARSLRTSQTSGDPSGVSHQIEMMAIALTQIEGLRGSVASGFREAADERREIKDRLGSVELVNASQTGRLKVIEGERISSVDIEKTRIRSRAEILKAVLPGLGGMILSGIGFAIAKLLGWL